MRPNRSIPIPSPVSVVVAVILLLSLTGWTPALRDPTTGLRLSGYQASFLTHDPAPKTLGPIVDVVDDATGDSLFSQSAQDHHAIGSITKLMTALLALRRLPLDRVVTISRKAASIPGSSMFLHGGDRVSVRALLYGLLIPSGNDAAEALAEAMAGNDRAFARIANHQARLYHLQCSHYVTPYGLDAKHQYSCAADVATMMSIVLKQPLLLKIMQTKFVVVHGKARHEVFPLTSTDELLGSYPGIIAGKTGTTDQAGASVTLADRQGGHVLICVVLNSTYSGRFSDCASLFSFAFKDFMWSQPADSVWSTASLEDPPSDPVLAPIPRWESAWITVGRKGMISVPIDSHR